MPQTQSQEVDTKQLVLSNAAFGPKEVRHLVNTIAIDFSQYRLLRDAVGELEGRQDPSPATNVRLGVCLYLLGRYRRASEVLAKGDGGALAHFYLAKCAFASERYDERSATTTWPGRPATMATRWPWLARKPCAMPTNPRKPSPC